MRKAAKKVFADSLNLESTPRRKSHSITSIIVTILLVIFCLVGIVFLARCLCCKGESKKIRERREVHKYKEADTGVLVEAGLYAQILE